MKTKTIEHEGTRRSVSRRRRDLEETSDDRRVIVSGLSRAALEVVLEESDESALYEFTVAEDCEDKDEP
jgi:hypothetical protein